MFSTIPTKLIHTTTTIPNYTRVVFLLVLLLGWTPHISYGYGSFGFDIHHRFSDPVKRVLDLGGDDGGYKLPEKGTVDYFAALAHRDVTVHGRRLNSATAANTPLTFSSGNTTYRIGLFGFLQYANVTVGTPGIGMAMDRIWTGSYRIQIQIHFTDGEPRSYPDPKDLKFQNPYPDPMDPDRIRVQNGSHQVSVVH